MVYLLDICVLNPFFHPYKGGTEKVLLEVYRRLAKRHNITVITSADRSSNHYSVEEVMGIRVVRLRSLHEHIPIFPMPFLFFDGLVKELRKADCDIYHINNRYQFFEDTVRTVKGMDRKLALTIHNAKPKNISQLTDDMGRFYDWLWGRKLMHAADVITGVSEYTIRSTVPSIDRGRTHLVYNGVDCNVFMRRSGREIEHTERHLGFKSGSTIVTNGRLAQQKGHVYLIKAVSELVRKGEDINLLIIGGGPLKRQLTEYARDLGMHDRFRIIYGLDDVGVMRHYNASSMFVLPSLYEPAGLALLEAMACELPSIASRTGGIPEIMGDDGLYARPKSSNSIMKKISYVLDNRGSALKRARRGRMRMIRRFNWDRIAKQYESIFLDTIRR